MEHADAAIRRALRTFYSPLHVVVMDALLRHTTARETLLADALHLPATQVRAVLYEFHAQLFASRKVRVEYVLSRRNGQPVRHTYDEWTVDRKMCVDALAYRVLLLNDLPLLAGSAAPAVAATAAATVSAAVAEYVCPACARRYTALDAMALLDTMSGALLCTAPPCRAQRVEVVEASALPRTTTSEHAQARRVREALQPLLDALREAAATPLPTDYLWATPVAAWPPNRRGARQHSQQQDVQGSMGVTVAAADSVLQTRVLPPFLQRPAEKRQHRQPHRQPQPQQRPEDKQAASSALVQQFYGGVKRRRESEEEDTDGDEQQAVHADELLVQVGQQCVPLLEVTAAHQDAMTDAQLQQYCDALRAHGLLQEE